MAYAFQVDGTKTPLGMLEKRNVNLYGRTNLKTVNTYWNTFGGVEATTTTSSEDWQINADDMKFTPAPNATAHSHFVMTAWRLASAVDSLNFKIEPHVNYYGQSGYRRWAQGAAAGTNSIAGGNTPYTSFEFEGANMTVLGFGAIAAAVMTMF